MRLSRPPLPDRPRSVWRANPPHPPLPALAENLRTAVVVVGAGIAGLSAALRLARAGTDVVVVEAGAVGDGVTAVSTAKASLLQGRRLGEILDDHGEAALRAYVEANRAGQEQIARWIDDVAPTARPHRATDWIVTTDDSAAGQVTAQAGAANAAGLDVTVHPVGVDTGLPFDVAAAVSLGGQLHLDPVPYLEGLAFAVVDAGGLVLEHTRVTGLSGLDGRGVVTDRGMVWAEHVIVTTGLPIFDRGAWFARAHPTRSYAVAVELADPADAPTDGFYALDTPSWSLRSATDPTDETPLLVVSGGGHVTGRDPHPLAHQQHLVAWATNRFDVAAVRYRWSAQDYRTADGLPAYGPLWALPTRVTVATGFDKWGFTNGTAAGMALAAMVDGEAPEWAAPFHTRRFHPQVAAKPFLTANAEVAYHLVHDWVTGGVSAAPDTGPRTPGATERAGGLMVDDDGEAVEAVNRWSDDDPMMATRAGTEADRNGDGSGDGVTNDDEPGEGRGVVIRRGLERVGVARVDGRRREVRAVCTHMGGVLAWNDAECSWDCPLHGSRFDADGEVLQAPACRALTRKPVPAPVGTDDRRS